ncbi:ParA family protein [Halostagnicola kamekurae]|uniref:AAA domain-containing protein n=1 Tax=Halostagnicola kamekurae TaxID=619731 RepID=A0A1I6UF98_9EURY|nr:ParA family protein [Halostagnicola kamekurae]SFT00064.1 AAA domain-containing protein [Halostagnicola kamekurae]
MYAYSVWSPERGPQTTALIAGLARAHAERDDRVLVVDFTPPGDGVSEYFGVEPGGESDENVVTHLIEENDDPFEELAEPVEPGVDLVPTHEHLADLENTLDQNAMLAEISASSRNYEYPRSEQLHRVISDSKAFYEYDIILVDAGSGTDQHAYNGIYAANRVLLPYEAGGDPEAVTAGFEDVQNALESIDVVPLGTVATGVEPGETGDRGDTPPDLPSMDSSIADCPSLFEDARVACSSFLDFEQNEEYRQLEPNERNVVESISKLAADIATTLKNPN